MRGPPRSAIGNTDQVTALVEQAEVDGVRVFSGASLGRAYGAIMFRVGHSDESLPRRGITHLVEHLALHPQDRRSVDFNGYVDLTTTVFHCQADSLAQVGEFLTATCRTLTALPFDRMEKEAQVLRAEAAQRGGSVIGTALWLRFGPTAFGTVEYEELFLHQPARQLVQAHVARHFTRGNAVVILSGPPPSTLDLGSLPPGGRMPVPISLPVEQRYPAWTFAKGSAVSITFVLPREPAVPAAMFVISSVLKHLLRETLAISYDVSATSHVLSNTHAHHVLRADCQLADADEVAARIQTELSRIIYDGCSPDDLAEYQHQRRRANGQPGIELGIAHFLANEWLYGDESADFAALDAEAEALTVHDVQRVTRLINDTALWLVPESAPITDRRVHLVAQWSDWAVHGTRYEHRRSQANDAQQDDSQLIAGHEGVTLGVPQRGYVSVSFDRLAACKRWADGARTMYGRDGFTLSIHPDDWVGGDQVVALIDRQVPHDFVIVSADRFRPA